MVGVLPTGLFGGILERARQARLDDRDFVRSPTYYFELRVPAAASVSGGTSYLFPLVLNPQQISIEEPFSVQSTQTQRGGLYVERQGIVQRKIKLRGTPGFKPRPYVGGNFNEVQANQKTYKRNILPSGQSAAVKEPYSGQRHFQFLQDAVFRTYSDLIQDPEYAFETQLIFHNPKDNEAWKVEPIRFRSDRSDRTRVHYPYDIELLAYETAEVGDEVDVSADKDIIDSIKDRARALNSVVNLGRGAVQDVTGLVNRVDTLVAGFANTIANAVRILDDVANLTNGASEVLQSPLDLVTQVQTSLAVSLENLDAATTRVPDAFDQSVRQLEDAFDRLRVSAAAFSPSTTQTLASASRLSELSTSRDRAALQAAADQAPPNTFQALLALGTANLPGDLLKADAELGAGRGVRRYQSATEYIVQGGDSLQGLARRFLGDAREWRAIAILNRLDSPYISVTGIPGTVTVGDAILIPSTAPPPEVQAITPVLGVSASDPAPERLLGTDLRLVRTNEPQPRFDLSVNANGDDFELVSGIENLSQAILTRVSTEKGTSQLYPNVGLEPIVATADAALDRDVALFRITQAVQADPRVVAVGNVRLNDGTTPDVVQVQLDVQPVSLTGSVPVTLEV